MDSKIWTYLHDYYKRTNPLFNANPEEPTFISNSSYIADVFNFSIAWALELCQHYYQVCEWLVSKPCCWQIGAHLHLRNRCWSRSIGLLDFEEADDDEGVFPRGCRTTFCVLVSFLHLLPRYVISDYTVESILKMKSHAWYSDFVKQGVVDFAIVNCEGQDTVCVSPFQSKRSIPLSYI